MLCERCQKQPASGGVSTVRLTSGGSMSETSERICSACFAAHEAAARARQAAVRADIDVRARDGTLFEGIRRQLAFGEKPGTEQELAHAAAYLDEVASALPVPLPADLRAFASRHRSPAASRGVAAGGPSGVMVERLASGVVAVQPVAPGGGRARSSTLALGSNELSR